MIETVGEYRVSGPVGGGRWQVSRFGASAIDATCDTVEAARIEAERLCQERREERRAAGERRHARRLELESRNYYRSPWTTEPGYAASCAVALGLELVSREGNCVGRYRVYATATPEGLIPAGWEAVDPVADDYLGHFIYCLLGD